MNKPNIPFIEFPKIARLSREIIVTEKIDGTNAQIFIPEADTCDVCQHPRNSHYTDGSACAFADSPRCFCTGFTSGQAIYAGSRTQWITPEQDNHGFARWVQEHREELLKLGPGSHFGEWWGSGIQRGYGLKGGEKRFSLFNVSRWADGWGKDAAQRPACCSVVPVLHKGAFQMEAIDAALKRLRSEGSIAAPGFMRPEGVVVYHTAGNHLYKKTIEKDEQPKGANR